MANLEHEFHNVYTSKHLAEWEQERQDLLAIAEKIQDDISSSYIPLADHVYMGSTALVWTVQDKRMKVARALKMPRPRPAKLAKIIKVIRDEANKLKSLNHHNIIRIFWDGDVSLNGRSSPYYIMEFLPGVQDFRRILTGATVPLERLIELVSEIVEGVAYLHKNEIIHCDLKPDNLLVPADAPPLVADLGYAKFFAAGQPTDGDHLTEVTFTPKYAHPDLRHLMQRATDSGANISEIKRKDLRYAFDLYAMGRTIFELMRLFLLHQVPDDTAARKAADDEQSFGFLRIPLERSLKGVDPYRWHYLWIIASRMLDGKNEAANCVPGLTPPVMDQIKYGSIQEVQLDFLKLTDRYWIETRIPELNIYERGYSKLPRSPQWSSRKGFVSSTTTLTSIGWPS
jgi:serine/threonine protein kinase